jgi:ferredoxin
MKTHQIELVELLTHDSFIVEVAEGQPILEAAEATGLELPVKCRIGACLTCAARLIEGEVEQSQAIVLSSAQKERGYVLLCVASPRSDCQFVVRKTSVKS